MYRPLAAILAFSSLLVMFANAQIAIASEPLDSGGAQGILQFRGGASFLDPPGGPGPGWLAGCSAGFLIHRAVLVMIGSDRMRVTPTQVVTPVTLQLEIGSPFQGRVAPRVMTGAGVYLVSTKEFTALDGAGFFITRPTGAAEHESIFALYLGGGLSIRLSSRVALDLGVRFHHSVTESSELNFATADGGLTLGL